MPPRRKEKKHIKLNEDEKNILKNLNKQIYSHIGREIRDGMLYLKLESQKDHTIHYMFPNLFKEIAERRRIRDKRIIRKIKRGVQRQPQAIRQVFYSLTIVYNKKIQK